ncbi:MAG: peptidase C39 family protein [Dongiaceae bacterium]
MPRKSPARTKAAPARKSPRIPHYGQTTDFTCGPSSLIMVMKALRPSVRADRGLELQLWREANIIFSGASGGHGGCSALGLALAAHRRGFAAEVHVNHKGVLLAERTTSKEHAEVRRVLHERDLKEARAAGIPVRYGNLGVERLEAALGGGALPIVLNSMEFLHSDPTAHWFVVTGVDDDNVYVNDPWVARDKGKTSMDMTGVPIPRAVFGDVTSYGQKRERAVVLVRRRAAG